MWVVHPLSMAASLCIKLISGGKTLLEWQTYTVDSNNGSLLILLSTKIKLPKEYQDLEEILESAVALKILEKVVK